MKPCSRCKIIKPATEFWLANRATGQLSKRCKACDKAAYHESRQRHIADRRRKERERYRRRCADGWQSPHLTPAQKEQLQRYHREYYGKHREIFLARTAAKDAARRFDKWLAGELRHHKNAGQMIFRGFYCPACGVGLKGRPAHLHHVRSYTPPDYLYTLPLCRTCHTELHQIQRELGVPILEATRRFLLRLGDNSSSCQTDSPDHGV